VEKRSGESGRLSDLSFGIEGIAGHLWGASRQFLLFYKGNGIWQVPCKVLAVSAKIHRWPIGLSRL